LAKGSLEEHLISTCKPLLKKTPNYGRADCPAKTEAAEAKFRGLLESAPTGVVIVNTEGEIVLVNHQTERLFGYRREEILGQLVEILLPESRFGSVISNTFSFTLRPVTRPMGASYDFWHSAKMAASSRLKSASVHCKQKKGC
jgi:transcriptional regulator with PAS, ATPase and Fis domain